jgi:hopene-associated glycosyltransferase HpnB
VLLFWVVVALDLERWWPSAHTLRRPGEGEREQERVLVVIPARNEACSLPATLPSLLVQREDFSQLVLVDDDSSDGTRALADSIAAASDSASKILITAAPAPPPGWSGKLHALQCGLRAGCDTTRGGAGGFAWYLFTDADIQHPPGSIRALLDKAAEGGHDLVSVMARLRVEGFWERLLVPPFVYFFQFLYPFRRVEDPRSRVAAAAGGCVLIRSDTLEKAGGLEAIRGAVIDDVALAARVQRAGGRCWLGLDPEIRSVRGYDTLAEMTHMVARTAFNQLGYRYSLLGGTLFFLGIFFASPPALALLSALNGWPIAGAAALLSWGIQAATFFPAVRHQRVRGLYALTLPLASVLYGYMTCVSAWRHLKRGGVEWKGRRV